MGQFKKGKKRDNFSEDLLDIFNYPKNDLLNSLISSLCLATLPPKKGKNSVLKQTILE